MLKVLTVKSFLFNLIVLGISFLLVACETNGPQEYIVAETVEQNSSIPHITINDVVFHSETFGDSDNPIVIVIHGGPGNDYKSLLPLKVLSDEFFVVFYDQRGTGLSPRVDPQELTLESSLSDLDSIIDYYGGGRKVNLIGHSWGGMLASGYLGRYPDKVDHAVLAEPGFLTTEMAEEFMENTSSSSLGFLSHHIATWFASLGVTKPDNQAPVDYYFFQSYLYDGADNPYLGYYCDDDFPEVALDHWRWGFYASQEIRSSAVDSGGKLNINLVEGVENFTNRVLFIASQCNEIIGEEWQKRQMEFFTNAELAIIQESGHMMFGEKPEESVAVVREFLNSPL